MIVSFSWTKPMLHSKKAELSNPDIRLKTAILDSLAKTIVQYNV